MFKNGMKKMIAIVIGALTLSVFVISPARSETAEELLALIATYTHVTSQAAFLTQKYTLLLLYKINDLMLPDDSPTSGELQHSFVRQTNAYVDNYKTRLELLQQLLPVFYGDGVTADEVPYANDMTYGTLLGHPFYQTDPRKDKPNAASNFIMNVAGLNITHTPPSSSWSGPQAAKLKYQNFYTTVSAIQSYDAFVLSQLYADNLSDENTPKLTDQQNMLMQQASNSDWFAKVASEKLGIVFRQMLMYNSQIYVLLTQLIQTQKQMLATLAMTNTLIVIGDTFTENQLIQRAAVSKGQ